MKLLQILLSSAWLILGVYSQDTPPRVKSFRAAGELTYYTEDNAAVQLYFEENYDDQAKRSSLSVTTMDIVATFTEYLDLKQLFTYNRASRQCTNITTKEYLESDIATPIGMKNFIIKDGNVIFPVRQLISLHAQKPTAMTTTPITYRDIPAKRWSFSFQDGKDVNVTVDAYWSTGENYTSPSKEKQVPLGFHLTRVTKGDEINPYVSFVNFFLFTHDEVNYKEFEPLRGVYCPGRADPEPFPDISQVETLTFQSEFVWEAYQTFSTIDTWFDPGTSLYRVDLIPTRNFGWNATQRRIIVSKPQGVAYEISSSSRFQCVVSNLSEAAFDPQTIMDYGQSEDWSIASLFGIKSAQFVSVGEASDRGIPCTLYHGLRKDWPRGEDHITTLWEWCIASNKTTKLEFHGSRYPIISLNIYIKESPYTESTGIFYKGLRFTHHFHNAKVLTSKYMDAAYFDIRDCFADENLREITFTVNVAGDDLKQLTKQDTDPEFVGAWKYAVTEASGLAISSMRISSLKVSVKDGVMKVAFALLGRHPSLQEESDISLEEAIEKLRSLVDSGQLKIDWNGVTLQGVPGSLKEKQLITDYDAPLTYSAGIMAAVAIITVLMGVGMGAGAVFTKKVYFSRE